MPLAIDADLKARGLLYVVESVTFSRHFSGTSQLAYAACMNLHPVQQAKITTG
jgi:hypothetical protein